MNISGSPANFRGSLTGLFTCHATALLLEAISKILHIKIREPFQNSF